MTDVLDNVMLSARAVRQWHALAHQAANNLPSDVSSKDIPDEQAEAQADGTLLIFVTLAGKRIAEMRVPRGEWTWQQ